MASEYKGMMRVEREKGVTRPNAILAVYYMVSRQSKVATYRCTATSPALFVEREEHEFGEVFRVRKLKAGDM